MATTDVTTTHDPAHGGDPRLTLFKEDVWSGEDQPVFWLGDRTTIGSSEDCDIILPDLEPHHATVVHDEEDELVVESQSGETRLHGEAVERGVLRTGARVQVGPHTLVYRREEFADHGRPYGGRAGGEAGEQQQQPRGDQRGW